MALRLYHQDMPTGPKHSKLTPVGDGSNDAWAAECRCTIGEFSVADKAYTMDLSRKNAADFRKALDKYISVATRVGSAPRGRKARRSKVDLSSIRAWAAENRFTVLARGLVSAEVKAAYEAAH